MEYKDLNDDQKLSLWLLAKKSLADLARGLGNVGILVNSKISTAELSQAATIRDKLFEEIGRN